MVPGRLGRTTRTVRAPGFPRSSSASRSPQTGVDDASHDTTSILATIEHTFHVHAVRDENTGERGLRDTSVADLATAFPRGRSGGSDG